MTNPDRIAEIGAVQAEPLSEVERLRKKLERFRTMSTIEMMCENQSVKEHVIDSEERWLKAEKRVEQLLAEVERLRGLLEKHGEHTSDCDLVRLPRQRVRFKATKAEYETRATQLLNMKCTCGLAAALSPGEQERDDQVLGNSTRELVSLPFNELQPNEQAKIRDMMKEAGINLVSDNTPPTGRG